MDRAAIATSTVTQSPIGAIPAAYNRMSELCRAAHIRYDENNFEGVNIRTWNIVYDKIGGTCLGHKKFCMILDLIRHEHPDWTKESIFDASLSDEVYKNYRKMDWKELNDKLAAINVRGYQKLKRGGAKSNVTFNDFLN